METNAFIIRNFEYEHLAATLSCIGDGIISTDLVGGVVFMNKPAEELTGWKIEDAIGNNLSVVLPIFDGDKNMSFHGPVEAAIQAGVAIGLTNNSYFISKEGIKKYISASCSPNKDFLGKTIGVVIVFRDITRLKQADEDLRIQRNNFQAMFEASPLGIAIVNEDVIIEQVNSAFLKLFNKNYNEVINKKMGNILSCVHSFENTEGCGSSETCELCKIKSVVNMVIKSKVITMEKDIKFIQLFDGVEVSPSLNVNFVPVNISGSDNVMLVIEDVTDQKQYENEIKESKAKYQSLFMNMNTGFAYFHILFGDDKESMDLEFIEVNSKFEELFKVKSGEIKGKTVKDIFPNIWGRYSDGLKTKEKDELKSEHYHIPEYYDETSGKWFSISSFQSGFSYYASLVSDITESKEAARELKRAKEAAESANKAKSQFLANMSHEIRTPLNGMVGMIDLTMRSNLNNDQRDNLNIAKSCTNILLKVINDILDYSKMEAGKLTIENISFNIKDLVEDIVKVHTIRASEKGLDLYYQLADGLPWDLIGDPSRLKQILNNLIGNAIKFTENGNVSVSVKKYMREGDLLELLFAVADTGIGIAKDNLDLLYKSFSQVDSSYTRKFGGTGLGLVISKQLIEMMGGKIWNDSMENNGTTFYFTIKLEIGEKKEENKSVIVPEFKNGSSYNILYVEDEKVNQMVIEHFLKDKGHSITIVENGKEAVSVAKNNKFDVILMDIQLPEMDGIQATAEIRKREERLGLHTPIIALTAYALKGDREKFLSLGMDEYISKPVDRDILLHFIEIFGSRSKKTSPINTGQLKVDILDFKDKIVNNDEEIDKIRTDIYKHLMLLKKAFNDKNIIIIESTAHLIKILATKIDELPVKNLSFKIELDMRRGDLIAVQEDIRKLEKEILDLKLKENNRKEV